MGRHRLTAFAWGVALLTALVWAATTFVAERSVPTLLLTYFVLPQVWVLLALGTLLVCVWRRSGPAIVGSGTALLLSLSLLGYELPQASRPEGAASFRLMTYNVARGGQGTASALAATIRAQRPDVVCLQEINGLKPGLFGDLLHGMPGYTAVRSREVALLSRFPVLGQQDTALPDTTRRLLSATLDLEGRRVTVLNAHFTTVLLRGGWGEARDRRAAQTAAVLRVARNTPGPFVACGDFNTPARGLVYARLRQTLANAFQDAGTGFGYTFPSAFPAVRIDHVWLRGAWAVRASVPRSQASDHLPLVVDVAF